MIPHGVSYEEAMLQFRWPKPAKFNIGYAVCERHPEDTLAMIVENADGSVRNWTFGQLLASSSRLANALAGRGVGKGDRVGVFLSQGAELTLCHLAGYRMGAIVLPLFTLFGEEALEYRLANADASALITDMSQLPKVLAVRERLPHLKTVIVIGAGAHGAEFLDWDRLLAAASGDLARLMSGKYGREAPVSIKPGDIAQSMMPRARSAVRRCCAKAWTAATWPIFDGMLIQPGHASPPALPSRTASRQARTAASTSSNVARFSNRG